MPAIPEPARVLAAVEAVQARLTAGGSIEGLLGEAVAAAVELSDAALGLLALIEDDDADLRVRVIASFASARSGAADVLIWLGDRMVDAKTRPKPLKALLANSSAQWQGYDPRMPTLDNLLALPSSAGSPRARLLLGNREGGFDAALVAALQPIATTIALLLELRRRAELDGERQRMLDYAEERFQTFLDAADCVAYLTDAQRRVRWANRAFAELVRLPSEQVVGQIEDEILPPTYAARTRDLDDEVRTNESLVHLLEPALGTDGEVHWWQGAKFPVRGPERELLVGGVSYDVTEHVHTATSLREREAELAEAQELARIGRWVWDVERDRVTWNLMFQRLAGLAGTEELDLSGLLGLLHPDDAALTELRLAEAVREGSARFTLEHRLLVDGELRELFVIGRVRRNSETGAQVIAVVQDVSERRRLERARRDLEAKAQRYESLSMLAGSVAYEFNGLLGGILGNAGIALDELPFDSLAAACVQDMEAAAEQAARLSRQMLAFSGRGRFVTESVDLSEVIAGMTNALQRVVSSTVSLRMALHSGLPPVDVDVAQIRQLMLNLVSNASEAIGERTGEVVVATGVGEFSGKDLLGAITGAELSPGRFIWLEVRDTGVGMDPATRARAFEPFFTTKGSGRGLGLAAVAGIVRSHVGALLIRSGPGEGTSIRVLLTPRLGRIIEAERSDSGWRRSSLR